MPTFYNIVTLLHPEELTYEFVKKKFMDLDLNESKNNVRNNKIFEINNNKCLCNYVLQKDKTV